MKVALLAVVLSVAGMAQDDALQRVVDESRRLQQMNLPSGPKFFDNVEDIRRQSDGLQSLLRDWLETVLPKSRPALDAEFPSLKAKLDADLWRAGVLGKDRYDLPVGLAKPVTLNRPYEAPDLLFATVGVGLPCGRYDVVYAYDYSNGAPHRVLESHGDKTSESVFEVLGSGRDANGSRLILTLRYAVQCASNWNSLSYGLFRLPANADTAAAVLGGAQWFFGYDYRVHLDPKDLLLEVDGSMLDTGILIRKHVLHFDASSTEPRRIDPVALLPQDFVDEWVTKPWTEMESRSDDLQKWHDFLAGGPDEFVSGTFDFVQPCQDKPGQWQIGVSFENLKGKELPEALPVYFLVQQSEQYKFRMTGISFDRQDGCPGETPLKDERPSLFPARKGDRL